MMAVSVPLGTPRSLPRATLWAYLEIVHLRDETDVETEIEVARAAGAITNAEAIIMRRKVWDAIEYHINDPRLLQVAALLGIANTQEELEAEFRAALQYG